MALDIVALAHKVIPHSDAKCVRSVKLQNKTSIQPKISQSSKEASYHCEKQGIESSHSNINVCIVFSYIGLKLYAMLSTFKHSVSKPTFANVSGDPVSSSGH